MKITHPLLMLLKFRVRFLLGKHPVLFAPAIKLVGSQRSKSNICTPETDIVIEGFYRSANTFAVRAFEFAQKKPTRIGYHLHVPAQIMYGCRYQVPTLLLVRNPLDVVVSLLIRSPWFTEKIAFDAYYQYYKCVLPYAPQVVIATFDEVVNDFGHVIRRINRKFDINFDIFEHSRENVQIVFQRIEEGARQSTGIKDVAGFVAFPTERKQNKKKMLKQKILEDMETRKLLDKCEQIYHSVLKLHEAQKE